METAVMKMWIVTQIAVIKEHVLSINSAEVQKYLCGL